MDGVFGHEVGMGDWICGCLRIEKRCRGDGGGCVVVVGVVLMMLIIIIIKCSLWGWGGRCYYIKNRYTGWREGLDVE